ncbi:MAG: arylesterase [Proteobacteria bacterium]|nr:arylesterase [Pseudomonadota bacterium]
MKKLIFLVLALIFLSCNEKNIKLKYLSESDVILSFGDSITYGVGAEKHESYPAILASLTKRTVIESGIPGETTEEGLKRLPELLDKYNPSLVILCEGGNDMLRQMDLNKTKENLRNMVKLIKDKGADVILVGVPKPGFIISVPDFYKEVAKEFNVPYEGKILKDILTNNRLKADPIHPNKEGYKLLAESIYKIMKSGGAI